jgi:hypothetical protein
MVKKTGARILAHKNAGDKISGMARGLGAGDVVKVGKTVELEVLDTPGHTMSHGPGTATTAAIRRSSTGPSPSSSNGCRRPR